MSQVFYRSPQSHYPSAKKAKGVYIYDKQGKQYLDGSGGAAVSCIGHSNQFVLQAIKNQLDTTAFAHTAFFTNDPQEQLAQMLSHKFGEPNAKVYFLSGGSEANETAVKLAHQYWVAKKQFSKNIIISRHQSYHGNTLATLSLSGNPKRQNAYRSLLHTWPKSLACHAYRYQDKAKTEEEYSAYTAQSLEAEILSAGPENVAAFIAEPVVGATLGCVPATAGYFKRIRDICDKYEVLLILDEVMSGCGRTGSYFAFEQEKVLPDIVTLAKGIGGGYLPLAATLCRNHIYETIVENCGSFEHGHTYVGHATACAAGIAVMQVIENDNLIPQVKENEFKLKSYLKEAIGSHPNVGNIRGRGHFIGIEFTLDKKNKTPPPPDMQLPQKLKQSAMENGVICYPGGGTADGVSGAHILLAPPFIYQDNHFCELTDKIKKTIEQQDFR